MATCIFAGSFDPVTIAHEYVINQCSKTFDKVVVAIGINDNKNPTFSVEERVELLKATFNGRKEIEVDTFSGLLVDYMKEKGIKVNVRGVRNQEDFQYEKDMQYFNQKMYPEMVTYFVPTPLEMTLVSSTAVRKLLKLEGNFEDFVPSQSVEILQKYFSKK